MRSIFQHCWLSALTAASILLSCATPIVAQENAVSAQSPRTTDSQITVRDVRLGEEGLLTARVVDAAGTPMPDQPVIISYQNQRIAQTASDEQGLVRVRGLRPGVHLIHTEHAATPVRLWTLDSAPPSAIKIPGLVSDETVVRGQAGLLGGSGFMSILQTGVTIATLVVAIDAAENAQDTSDQLTLLRKEIENAQNPASP